MNLVPRLVVGHPLIVNDSVERTVELDEAAVTANTAETSDELIWLIF
jgi:hypothetical protein